MKKLILKRAGLRLLLFAICGLYIPALLIWNSLIIYFTFHQLISKLCILIYILGTAGLFLFQKNTKSSLKIFSSVSILIIFWFLFLPATNDKNWAAECAKLPQITQSENKISVDNFRHFIYEENTILENYRSQDFDLDQLEGTDLIISYWDNFRSIGHTFLSFRFKNGQNLAVSLEVRKEVGESYHPARGLFKQFELIYIFGDERDLIPLRTEVRHEQTFLYPMKLNVEHSKLLLLDIIKTANDLHDKPQFYHTFGRNCTTGMIDHLNSIGDFDIPFSKKVLLNGVSDFYAYELGGLPNDLPFDILKRSCYVSDTVQGIPLNEEFSLKLRKIINNKLKKERGSIEN